MITSIKGQFAAIGAIGGLPGVVCRIILCLESVGLKMAFIRWDTKTGLPGLAFECHEQNLVITVRHVCLFSFIKINYMTTNFSSDSEQLIYQALVFWKMQNQRVTEYFSKHEDAFYLQPIVPGKNRPVYLLGHLIAVNDGLLPLFGLGEQFFPEYRTLFLSEADNTDVNYPSVADLKQNWEKVNGVLEGHFDKMTVQDWLSPHNSVSAEDFEKDKLRNKFNVLLNRTNHQAYHVGQLRLLK